MSDNVFTQAQQNDAWRKMLEDHGARLEKGYEEAARFQQKGLEQAQAAVEEMAKLQKETLAYFGELSSEWRKVTLEAARATASMFAGAPRAS